MSEKREDKFVCEACAFMTLTLMKNIWNTIVKCIRYRLKNQKLHYMSFQNRIKNPIK
jgi:hypothetical protein